MKKIYITSLHMMHGGVEMAIALLANALVKKGYSVEILCIYNLGKPAYKIDERVQISYLTDLHPNREEFKKALGKHNVGEIIKEGIYAVKVLWMKKRVMVQSFKKINQGIIISTRNEHSVLLSRYGHDNVLKIAQLHHDHRFDKRLLKDFEKNYGRIDTFVLLTDLLKQEVQEIMKDNKHTRITVVPNFLENLEEETVTERKNQVVAVGRLHEVKGFERLIKLWKKLDIKNKPVLKIIGDGKEKEKLQKLVETYQMDSEVILAGEMNHCDVMEEMRQSLLYVMTSFTEAFPFVLIEAMSAGLPVVAYDVRVGPGAIVENELNGFLVPDDSEEEYINRLVELLEDESLRQNMSNAAFIRGNQFTEKNVIEKWIEILEV